MEERKEIALLMSGGVDSAALCVDLCETYSHVYPLYIRFGLRWEDAEVYWLSRFLKSVERANLQSVTILDEPIDKVYGKHWSLAGEVPNRESPDESVYLPGRNLLLVVKSSVWCRFKGVSRVALATLASNPFSDASNQFFAQLGLAIRIGLAMDFKILTPYENVSKEEILRKYGNLPMQLTFSCLQPIGMRHCGACNKCAERHRGFLAARQIDPTDYSVDPGS